MTRGGLANLHARQARGALKKRVGGNADAGANHSAKILAFRGNAIEGGRGAEIDDHAGTAIFFECGHAIHDAVSAHFGGIVVVHRHAGFHSRLDQQRLGIEVALANLAEHGIERRHDRRNHDAVNAGSLEAGHRK